MLERLGKKGRVAATVLSVALSATLVSPASADVPVGAPQGTQGFASDGKATMIYGSGSDTTYTMHQSLAAIFNRAPGCLLQAVSPVVQQYNTECNPEINALVGKAPGFANYDRDLVSDYFFIGSGGGRNHVSGWNQGTLGYSQADYFRSSSSGSPIDGRSIAFARDALAAFTFDTVQTGVGTIISGNNSRLGWGITNYGTGNIYLKFGAGATVTTGVSFGVTGAVITGSSFNLILKGGNIEFDNNGGSFIDFTPKYNGPVSVAQYPGVNIKYISWELV
jgi:hypothetical protein